MFTGVTPESLIPRSDSRDPATTCKGITKSGRPCRRPIDAKESQGEGVVAVTSVIGGDSEEDEIGAAAYFCWQHKDQAETLAARATTGPETRLYPLKERNSIDTLVERLGVLDVEEQNEGGPRRKRTSDREGGGRRRCNSRPPRRINRPATWDNVQGPLMSVPSDVMAGGKRRERPSKPAPQGKTKKKQKKKKQSFWAFLCCGSADDDNEYTELIRPKKKTDERPAATNSDQQQHAAVQEMSQPQAHRVHQTQHSRRLGTNMSSKPAPTSSSSSSSSRPQNTTTTTATTTTITTAKKTPARQPLGEKPTRYLEKTTHKESETAMLLRYIPTSLAPKLASTLLGELSKPISAHDQEGFIYIFWLTPEAAGPAPSAAAASGLLGPPTASSSMGMRRTSDVMRQYSVQGRKDQQWQGGGYGDDAAKEEEKKKKKTTTILLKIGRANNVHRRMNEWTRQCGYSLSLVRYYPHVSSSSSPENSRQASYQDGGASLRPSPDTVRKVPHAHRVERLIHVELGEQRVIKQCEACGKSHKEWFEVEGTREGVKKVDEVVKRWVEWAEKRNE